MAATEALPRAPKPGMASADNLLNGIEDPFARPNPEQRRASHRYSAFDLNAFSQNQSTASPSSAKRALEAHLQETNRRLEEASKLGTALVNQRGKIADRLKEVEQLQTQQEIGPELKQKLVDIEKEYDELGRDAVRASMAPKGRHMGSEDMANGQAGSPAVCTK